MLARYITLAFVVLAALTSGCAVTSTTKTGADGSTTTTRSAEWVTGYPSGYYVNVVPYRSNVYGHDYYNRGRNRTRPHTIIPATPAGTCPGLNGQNIGGWCHYY